MGREGGGGGGGWQPFTDWHPEDLLFVIGYVVLH